MATIRVYTGGTGIGNHFPLSESVHLSLLQDGQMEAPLNDGYGMLFATSIILPDQTIAERLLKSPGFVPTSDGWGIVALRVDLEGVETDADSFAYWTTKDFVTFQNHGMVARSLVPEYDPQHPVTEAAISQAVCDSIRQRWLAEQTSEAPLFPLADGYADPVLRYWQQAWYFIATNDNTNAVGLYIRKASSMMDLFAPQTPEHCILARNDALDFVQTFWAPELHVINGRLTILLALGGKVWGPQCHMMFLKEGGDPTRAEDWETPVRVCLADRQPLTQKGITLDMTYVHAASGSYLVWSYREHIGEAKDTGSMLMIARVDEKTPWKLTSDPIVLSRPLFAWENRDRTINNEGPYPLYVSDDIYLTYSGGAAGGESYTIGYLKASSHADLTDPAAWYKSPMPVLHSLRVPNVYGPGHNAIFTDEHGNPWISYHAQRSPEDRIRRTGIHPIRFFPDGTPIFDLKQA